MMGMMTSILVGLNFGRSGEGRDEHGIIIIFILVSVDQLRSGYHGISYPRRCNDMSDWVRDGSSSGIWRKLCGRLFPRNNNEI